MYDLETYERLAHRCRHRPYDTNCVELSNALVSLIHEVRRLGVALQDAETGDADLDNGGVDMQTRLHMRVLALQLEVDKLRAENVALRRRIDQLGDGA